MPFKSVPLIPTIISVPGAIFNPIYDNNKVVFAVVVAEFNVLYNVSSIITL